MSVCIVWEKMRKGFLIAGLINILIFIILISLYFVLSKTIIEILSGPLLIIGLTASGLVIIFFGTYAFHVAVDAFRRMRKLDKATRRGLEICVQP